MLKINRQKDERVVHACTNNLADIPNGVTVCSAELVPDSVLLEGTAIAPAADGLYHVCKTAKLTEAATTSTTDYKVAKGHQFKVGDFVMAKVGGKAYAITAINNGNPTYDVITVGTTLGVAVKVGESLQLAAAESTGTSSKLKYAPIALTGDGYDIKKLDNHAVSAVTIGQFKKDLIPAVSDDMMATLRGIVLI